MTATALFFLILLHSVSPAALRPLPFFSPSPTYIEAPQFRNADDCPASASASTSAGAAGGGSRLCDPSLIHIAMTLDAHYLRGSIAAVHSILRHASCPESLFFHFIATEDDLSGTIRVAFPSLRFRVYRFHGARVQTLISASVRSALENPLNYARNYLADLLDPCIRQILYLDSDIVVVDDIRRLRDSAARSFAASSSAVIAAPEYCHANFTRYFTAAFWNGPLNRTFDGRRRPPCYFNTGVMAIELQRWREKNYGRQIEHWMEIQKGERIYDLGSLPPFLLVFAGEVEGLEHRWNQHGLGGDNVKGSCRGMHPGPVSLLHWSGKGKPWDRMDAGKPCLIDYLWKMYDLHASLSSSYSSSSIFSW